VEADYVARVGACKQEVFLVLRESHADVVSHKSARIDDLRKKLSRLGHQLPQSHFLRATDGKLIVLGGPQLHVFHHAAPGEAARSLCKDRGHQGHLSDDVAVRHVPNEHLAIQGVPSGQQESVVVAESQVADFMIVLRQAVNGLFAAKVPHHDVRVLASLARRNQIAIVRDC